MGLWGSLFRRSKKKSDPGMEKAKSELAEVMRNLRKDVVDLRPEANRQRDKRARDPLEDRDENIAKKLVELSVKLRDIDRKSDYYSKKKKYDEFGQRIRKIGQELCANGGSDRMDLICYRVQHLMGTSYYIRRNWDGICGWFY